MNKIDLNGRTAVVTGGAQGFGKAVTERFTRTSKNGLEYAATVADPKTFQDIAHHLQGLGARTYAADRRSC